MTHRTTAKTWSLVVAYAIGMAFLEAACVYYLRTMVQRVEPYQANPLPFAGALGNVEILREISTLVMLAAVGALAGRTWRTRLGYTAIAFGVWDIGYYAFLRIICGWPQSMLDWDVLFLVPVPWWGPVLAPMCIAVLLIAGGTLTCRSPINRPLDRVEIRVWRLMWLGVLLAFYTFMADSLDALWHGIDPKTAPLPVTFNWPIFVVALALLAAPVAYLARPSPKDAIEDTRAIRAPSRL
jgi:hypothetical protein